MKASNRELRVQRFNFLKSLIMIFSLLKRGPNSKNLILLTIIVCFQAILDVLSLASIIPLIYLIQVPDELNNTTNFLINLGFISGKVIGNISINLFIPALVILIMIISTLFRLFLIYKTNKFIEDTRHNLSINLMSNYINNKNFINVDKTEIAKSILSEVDQFIIIVFQPTILMLTNLILLLGIIFYLIYTSYLASIYSLILLFSFYYVFYIFSKRILNKTGVQSERSNKGRFKTAIESFNSIKDIKIYKAEDFFIKRFNKFSRSFANTNSTYTTLTASPKYILEMLVFIALSLSILFFVINDNLSFAILPLISTFAFAAYKAQPALSSVIFGINSIEYGSKIISNLSRKINQKFKTINKTNLFYKNLKKSNNCCIAINNLQFSHDNNPKLYGLNNINIEINYKSLFILVGESGSGKTTLLNLITGLEFFKSGSITFNTNLYNGKKPKISYLNQDHSLFNASIMQNVAFGLNESEIDLEKLSIALKKAEIFEYVFKLKNNIYENVGENGSKLSTGQIQRIALARSLYFNPDILILDEPTSALDKNNESKIINTLKNLSKEITVIITTHRIENLPENAKIYYLNPR